MLCVACVPWCYFCINFILFLFYAFIYNYLIFFTKEIMFGNIFRSFESSFCRASQSQIISKFNVTSQPHIMKIRKHRVRKDKWRKRVNRDWFQNVKKHIKKKQKVLSTLKKLVGCVILVEESAEINEII